MTFAAVPNPGSISLLLLPQYEFFAATLGVAAVIVTGWRSLGVMLGRWSGGRNLFFRLFLSVWFLGIFVGLSLGGEKMPWLVTHIALPLILLSAVLISGVIDRAIEAARARRSEAKQRRSLAGEWAVAGSLFALACGWFSSPAA